MKILFSNAPWWENYDNINIIKHGIRAGSRWPFTYSTDKKYIKQQYFPYPFFMGYATSYVKDKYKNYNVCFRDSIMLKESYSEYYNYLIKENFDFIVFETSTPSLEHDINLIENIKNKTPNSKIILVGPNVYSEGRELLNKCNFLYSCVCGEYEKGIIKILNGEKGFINYDLLTSNEMNSSPFPYHDINSYRYFDDGIGALYPQAQIFSSRGCPYKCVFCVWPATMTGNDPDGTNTRKVRFYSKEYMDDFLSYLKKNFDFKSFYFDDDTFNLNDSHVLGICEIMQKIKLPWTAMCRADTIKKETWKEMKTSGCVGVKIGFESGNQWVIDNIVNKNLNLEEAKDICLYLIKDLNLKVHGTFTIGLPGETESQMNDTKNFIKSIPFTSYQLSGCGVMSGTPLGLISNGNKLKNYSGAKLDNNFINESNGVKKLEKLIKQ